MATKKKTKTPKTSKKLVATDLVYDWKESVHHADLQRALKPFGIVVTEDPATESNDSFGFIFSNRKLTKAELEEYKNRC